MAAASDLIELAEQCFRQAEGQQTPSIADSLREMGLRHLEEAHRRWRQQCAQAHPRAGTGTT